MRHYIIRDIILSGLDNNTELLPESKIVKDLFDNIFSELIEDTYENGIKWHKNDITYFQQDDKNEYVYINYTLIRSVLESQLGYNNKQINELAHGLMEQHLKRKVFLTVRVNCYRLFKMEHHLKRKVFPTHFDYC